MAALEAMARLRAMDLPVFRTGDAAGAVGASNATASRMLARMAGAGLLVRLVRGRWAFPDAVDPLVAAQVLTSPWPCYGSLQTALYHHGMIEQVPQTTYLVSLAPTRAYATPIGTFSVHRIAPDFFFGWEDLGRHGAKLACPEKALLDVLYLAPARSRLFATLPELELPRTFSATRAREMAPLRPATRHGGTRPRGDPRPLIRDKPTAPDPALLHSGGRAGLARAPHRVAGAPRRVLPRAAVPVGALIR